MAEPKKMTKNPMVGTKVKAVPKPKTEIGIDTTDSLPINLINSAISSSVDISKIDGFSTVTQSREQIYKLIDTMAEDPILASYLKTISEDSVETNDSGKVIWCESSDEKCAKYITYLLDSINVDKHAYRWMHSLIKYGDLYLRLFRQSDYEVDEIFKDKQSEIADRERLDESLVDDNPKRLTKEEVEKLEKTGDLLKENVKVNIHNNKDHYVHYVEMVPNPGEMFELTKFGKTMGYVKAPINIQTTSNRDASYTSYLMYKMKKHDVEVYSATDFVHACLEDNSSRVPEIVDIFQNDDDYTNETKGSSFTVKRGQSELAGVFKIWRELSLLENSALLNRITKSSIIRTIQVEVGNMPKEQVGPHLQAIKSLMEQKSAINTNASMSDYTNPGPIENYIYIPVHEGKGAITAGVIGGDFDPKQLTDIDHFQDKLFGALGIPKAFFGVTDDGAGFNGGTSLSIQSSRYGKSVKRIQNTMCQMITDLVNLMLLDKGLNTYINKFTIKMQTPVTQEELDRRENKKNKIGVIGDIMMQLNDISNPVIKLKILKSLLSDSLTDTEVISYIQEQIDELEKTVEEGGPIPEAEESSGGSGGPSMTPPASPRTSVMEPEEEPEEPTISEPSEPTGTETEPEETITPIEGDSYLPSPAELNIDATDNSQF